MFETNVIPVQQACQLAHVQRIEILAGLQMQKLPDAQQRRRSSLINLLLQ